MLALYRVTLLTQVDSAPETILGEELNRPVQPE